MPKGRESPNLTLIFMKVTDQARKIAAFLGMEFTFAKNLEFENGWYGNAVLSKLPIVFSENKIYKYKGSSERRGLLHVIVKISGERLHFFATHLGVDSLESAAEAKDLLNSVLDWGLEEPVIIAGDFNMEPHYQRIAELHYYFQDVGYYLENTGLTYPSLNPSKRIDYIFSNDKLSPIAAEVVDDELTKQASDHLPFIVNFQF